MRCRGWDLTLKVSACASGCGAIGCCRWCFAKLENAPSPPHRTWSGWRWSVSKREEIVKAIAEICAEMKGPMSNLERQLLNEDRKDLRRQLAVIDRIAEFQKAEATHARTEV